MYSFTPTEEQQMLIDSIKRFSTQDLRVNAHDADEDALMPESLVEKGWELGLLQASIPEQYGGFGERSAVTGVLAAEELAWGDLAGALAIMVPGLYTVPILVAGSEEQKLEHLPQVIEAEWRPFTAALIEPTFDFDPNDLRTTAVVAEDGYELNGTKAFVPYADQAEGMIVYANLDGRTQGFIVPKDAEGVEVEDRQKLMGIHALPVYRVNFNGLRLPFESHLAGAEGHEFAPIMDSMRVAMAAMAVGLSRAAYEFSRDYAKEREVFGVKVAQKQAIAFMLAEMATEIEAIRLLVWEAAWMLDKGKEDASKHAYLAFTAASDMAMMITDRAVQILGGHGYIREFPVEMWLRNGRGITAFTGLAIV